jgi:hypothetical protein
MYKKAVHPTNIMTTVVLVHRRTEEALVLKFPTTDDFSAFLKTIHDLRPNANWQIDPESTHHE